MGKLLLCLMTLVLLAHAWRNRRARRRKEAKLALLDRIAREPGRELRVYADRTMLIPLDRMPFKRQWDFARELRLEGLIDITRLAPQECYRPVDRLMSILELTGKGRQELHRLTGPPIMRQTKVVRR